MRLAAIAMMLCALVCCGREELEGLGEDVDSGVRDAQVIIAEDAAVDPRIGADCTNMACGNGLVCVHPTCAAGADAGAMNCTPHFPFCVAVPPSCADPANCACYPQDVCIHGMGSCTMILNAQLYCANA